MYMSCGHMRRVIISAQTHYKQEESFDDMIPSQRNRRGIHHMDMLPYGPER